MKARDFATQLQTAVSQRETHRVEALLSRLNAEDYRLASVASVSAAAAAAGTFVTKERAQLTNFQATFDKLPKQLPPEPEAAQVALVAGQLSVSQNALDALAPDLKAENQPRLQAFQKQWQTFLSTSSTLVNTRFEKWVSSAENECDQIDYRSPIEKSTAQVVALSNLVREITSCESEFTNYLSLRAGLLQRSSVVCAKFVAFDSELKKLDAGMAAIRKAHTLQEFSDGAALMASSEFSGSPAAAAAGAFQTLNPNEETILRNLLDATNAGTWAYIEKEHLPEFIPSAVMPAERALIEQLHNDPAISANHQRSKLWLDADGTTSAEWITVGGFDSRAYK